jgi:serine/threonine-protein kinase
MIGEQLGRYNLRQEIGSGSMGTVYRAQEMASGDVVAVKVVRASVLYDADRRERFLQDLLTVTQIRHPAVCPILEIGDDEDDFFIVMPLLEGETLRQAMKRRPLPWRTTLHLGIAVGEALAVVHSRGAVHRALKPGNIWIRPDRSVLLTDCCVARFTELEDGGDSTTMQPRPESADTMIPMNALAYMSPEQVRGKTADHRSDIFALGAILYEMLSDRHPFEARNSLSRLSAILDSSPAPLTSKKQRLPAGLDAILRKAMAGSRGDRYSDVHEFVDALRSVLDEGEQSDGILAEVKSKQEKREALLRFVTYAALLSAIILVVYLFLSR